jgi:hypothetical protein
MPGEPEVRDRAGTLDRGHGNVVPDPTITDRDTFQPGLRARGIRSGALAWPVRRSQIFQPQTFDPGTKPPSSLDRGA